MSNRIHALAQKLIGKSSIEECSLEEVQHLVKRYPYFAPAQFLLLQKLKQEGKAEAEVQESKAILYYHDSLLFTHFMSTDRFYVDEETFFDSDEINTVHTAWTNDTKSAPEEKTDAPISFPLEAIETFIVQPETNSQQKVSITLSENISSIKEGIAIEPAAVEIAADETLQKEVPLPPAPAEQSSINTSANELTFEPYHTVDYFASQGIKISLDEVPKDKLGKQLKSFTEWLKTMKRLPSVQGTVNMEASAEKKVESMADSSITESDVVTEAMAEVWAKQGAREKAKETYNKLSLLNPSKRAYFAGKIENLKQS